MAATVQVGTKKGLFVVAAHATKCVYVAAFFGFQCGICTTKLYYSEVSEGILMSQYMVCFLDFDANSYCMP